MTKIALPTDIVNEIYKFYMSHVKHQLIHELEYALAYQAFLWGHGPRGLMQGIKNINKGRRAGRTFKDLRGVPFAL